MQGALGTHSYRAQKKKYRHPPCLFTAVIFRIQVVNLYKSNNIEIMQQFTLYEFKVLYKHKEFSFTRLKTHSTFTSV